MKIIGNISSIASIIGFLFLFQPQQGTQVHFTNLQWICLMLFLASSIFVIILNIKGQPSKFRNKSDIDKYMFKWISRQGRATIFTRDMSWADSEQMINMLKEKAMCKDLTIVMSHETSLTNSLKQLGAEVIIYGDTGFIPQSRFTIIRAGRSDAKVAIGRTYGDDHIIEEFDNGSHPLFYLASDLITLISKIKNH